MGGNAFHNVRRIHRTEIDETIKNIFFILELHNLGFDLDYMYENLMGSAKKQNDSGDLDIGVQKSPLKPFSTNKKCWPKSVLNDIADRASEYLGNENVYHKGIRGGQLNLAWPIAGTPHEKVQVDFIWGELDWLKFTHYSAGFDCSPYKGVFNSTLLAVIAKTYKEYEEFNETGLRVRRVGLKYDLEKGLHRVWERSKLRNQGHGKTTPDDFETHTPNSPRFSRLGYVDDPETVLEILFKKPVSLDEVKTFESLWRLTQETFPHQISEIKERTVQALLKSSAVNNNDKNAKLDLENLEVWRGVSKNENVEFK